jgi:hypothetical protein
MHAKLYYPSTISPPILLFASIPLIRKQQLQNRIGIVPPETLVLPRSYFQRLPISNLKKKDLLSLVNDGIIPKYTAEFYANLLTARDVKNKVPYFIEEDVDGVVGIDLHLADK